MAPSSVKRQILDELERLSPEQQQQQQATDLIRDLVAKPPAGASGRDLLRFAGTLDDGIDQFAARAQHDLVVVTRDAHFTEVPEIASEAW